MSHRRRHGKHPAARRVYTLPTRAGFSIPGVIPQNAPETLGFVGCGVWTDGGSFIYTTTDELRSKRGSTR